jgi:enoyl-[acyl-carrier protein] reductase II
MTSKGHEGAAFLGCRYPILGGAMTWVSERSLVSALSNAGAFGVLACGAMSPERLREEIQATRALTDKPFGVNLILMHPELDTLIDVVCGEKVSHLVFAGGIPAKTHIDRAHQAHVKVMGFAPNAGIAKKLVKSGIDALIIEGHEAGGHIGPVSTTVLVQEVLGTITEVPVFVAGGIGNRKAVAAYMAMGAAGCQLGTRFVCAIESRAHPKFKAAFINASARDAVVSTQLDKRFPVIPVRALKNQGMDDFVEFQRHVIDDVDRGTLTLKEGQLKIEHYWAGALRRAVMDGDVDTGSLMCGQSVGMVTREEPVADILADLVG